MAGGEEDKVKKCVKEEGVSMASNAAAKLSQMKTLLGLSSNKAILTPQVGSVAF